MKAVCWHGKHNVQVDTVPDPQILNPRDAIIRVSLSGICGSDLHLYDGYIPTMRKGDVLGHEFMGEVVEVGSGIKNLDAGDRVIVPFPIACGNCWYCQQGMWSLCDNSNPNAWMLEKVYGDTGAGIFGYSHLYGGYSGGQAELVRVPFADVGLHKVPSHLSDEQVLFLTDIFPTGYQAAENCNIHQGDTVAVWGSGPVGLLALKSAKHLGAEKIVAIDHNPDRLAMARTYCNAETLNFEETDVVEELHALTGGRGPDSCIDAVGMEAEGTGIEAAYDTVKQALRLENDRPMALRQLIKACRKGGTISIPGVYSGFVDKMPMGAVFAKGLTIRTGQTHVHKYVRPLMELIEKNEIDTRFIITHRMSLDEAPQGYKLFLEKQDGCVKIVLNPRTQGSPTTH
ncbi:zinc-dependent alcohol dehydrogenase [Geobacter sp. SVR]|uniref:zinc-dependent alcohol dehydrogenase n=1 Tax=Geobacter sp. SVR TaxID=2495594 RepID=UPI00143F02B0|nr:zinc-dependent alcohol dehydrogenase [Geobacter sp. SVR]BCS53574.1 glutathione-dependent formaldehyde dehydrogenase [Geobacter sp. SVR]GCF84229.1 glutathione-dependent formaldehyde dehydrogenase [Geobacter sp. SVR]